MVLHAKKVPTIFFLQQVNKFILGENFSVVKTASFNQVLIRKKGGLRICHWL